MVAMMVAVSYLATRASNLLTAAASAPSRARSLKLVSFNAEVVAHRVYPTLMAVSAPCRKAVPASFNSCTAVAR